MVLFLVRTDRRYLLWRSLGATTLFPTGENRQGADGQVSRISIDFLAANAVYRHPYPLPTVRTGGRGIRPCQLTRYCDGWA